MLNDKLLSYQDTKRVGLLNQLFLLLKVTTLIFSMSIYAQNAIAQTALNSVSKQQSVSDIIANLGAKSDVDLVEKQAKKLEELAEHKQWQHLIFYKNGQADVISADFYLSKPESISELDPEAELLATLKESSDKQTLCRYPARYYWLADQLEELDIDFSDCKGLPNADNDISMVLISSYLKNPASSFGHVLIKINDNDRISDKDMVNKIDVGTEPADFTSVHNSSSQDLLNQSYNFGARIPEQENDALYAFKGLFGFYDAGFSQVDFFKQDAVYSKTEQRDMWEYVLDLDTFNRTLLHYHLYEAKQARFAYYFVKQNCAYRSGEVLELIKDINITKHLRSWYTPDFIFNQLVEFKDTDNIAQSQQKKHKSDLRGLVKEIRYLPSEQTILHQKFEQLSSQAQTTINKFIRSEDMQMLSNLAADEEALIIDYLIMHRNYKISQTDSQEKKTEHKSVKKQLIRQRFTLPTSDDLDNLELTFKLPPTQGSKNTRTAITVSEDGVNTNISLFIKDPLNRYADINKHFEMMHLDVDYNLDSQLDLNKISFLEMQQIESVNKPLADEPSLSWQLASGIKNDSIKEKKLMAYADFGFGKGVLFKSDDKQFQALGYAMLNGHLHNLKGYFDVSSQLGMRIKDDGKNQSAQLEYMVRLRDGTETIQNTSLTLRQGVNRNNDVRFTASYLSNPNLEDQYKTEVKLGLYHYW